MKALLAALLVATPSLAAEVQGPVAVMPFKNLNADPNLEWLRVGMAETMVSDLKRGGRLAVVERAQIDKALAELALQTATATEESTAARVGKMTGARTVVVGSFQESAKQLRINARFVAVETGEVVGAAKATGPAGDVFVLQDEIIARLTGVEPKAVARAKPRKRGEPTFKAYKLYAMALTTASDADKVSYLKEAVSTDPDFTYAQDELQALRERLKQLEARSEKALEASQSNAESVLDDPKLTPQDRAREAVMLLGKLISTFHYAKAKRFATRVIEMNLPASNGMDPTEIAHYYVFLCQLTLKETDPGLRTGEDFLRRYPTSMYFQGVQMQMQTALDKRQAEGKEAKEAEEKLAEIEKERAERKKALEKRPDTWTIVERGLDMRECSELHWHHQHKRAIDTCTRMAEKWAGQEKDPQKDLALNARYLVILSYADLGDFNKARALAQKLVEEQPEFARTRALETVARTWPRD